MLIRSALISDASGAMDGLVAARNRGGLYFRQRTAPANPSTTAQANIRRALGYCMGLWHTDVSQDQRQAWEQFSRDNPRSGRLATLRSIGGMDEFLRANVIRWLLRYAGFASPALPFDPPDGAGAPGDGPLSITVTGGSNTANVEWDGDPEWAADAESYALVWFSPASWPTTRNFYARRYVLCAGQAGNAGPLTPPFTVTMPTDCSSGGRMFWRYRFTYSDGRLSPAFRGHSDAP